MKCKKICYFSAGTTTTAFTSTVVWGQSLLLQNTGDVNSVVDNWLDSTNFRGITISIPVRENILPTTCNLSATKEAYSGISMATNNERNMDNKTWLQRKEVKALDTGLHDTANATTTTDILTLKVKPEQQ